MDLRGLFRRQTPGARAEKSGARHYAYHRDAVGGPSRPHVNAFQLMSWPVLTPTYEEARHIQPNWRINRYHYRRQHSAARGQTSQHSQN